MRLDLFWHQFNVDLKLHFWDIFQNGNGFRFVKFREIRSVF